MTADSGQPTGIRTAQELQWSAEPARRRRWPWVLSGVLLLLLVAYAGAAWALSGRVPAGVSVGGVRIGGLEERAAVDRLSDGLAERLTTPVEVTVGSATDRVEPEQAGLGVDVEGTVDDLVGFSLDPRSLWRHVAGESEVTPRLVTDRAAVEDAVAQLAERVDGEPVDGGVTFADGSAKATPAREGRVLDRDGAADVLAQRWFDGETLELSARITPPAVDESEVEAALEEFARPATAGPLVVAVGDRRVELEPAVVTPALSMAAVDGRLEPRVDGAVLQSALLEKDPAVVTPPRNATVRLEGGRPVVVPGQDGTSIDPGALAQAVVAALPTRERTATVTPVRAEPEVTTAEAEALGVKEEVSSFATNLTADARRTENLRIAARTVNGTLVLPGETFSLNGVLGRRTPEKGYNEAPVIVNGRLTRDFGGGVSQMATTLFNAMFFAGLEDVEHKPHSFYISRYPEGREATVNYPTVDLKFRNDSPHGVLIETWVSGGQVHARFWSTTVWDEIRASKSERRNVRQPDVIRDPSPDCVPQEPSPGFDVTVTRSFVRGGAVERTETFNTRYIPEDHVICG